MKNTKKAFTLAEVLLVVAIIGVIAAMAIPNLNKSVNEDKTIMLFRNTADQLSAAYGKVISEYGTNVDKNETDCPSGKSSYYCFAFHIVQYLDVGYDCGDTNKDKCFSNEKITMFDGSNAGVDKGNEDCYYTFLLANGVGVCYRGSSFELDLNGPKKGPNSRGIDLFRMDTATGALAPEPSNYVDGSTENENFIEFVNYDKFNKWAFEIGNLDYLRCADSLNWINKHTCD